MNLPSLIVLLIVLAVVVIALAVRLVRTRGQSSVRGS